MVRNLRPRLRFGLRYPPSETTTPRLAYWPYPEWVSSAFPQLCTKERFVPETNKAHTETARRIAKRYKTTYNVL